MEPVDDPKTRVINGNVAPVATAPKIPVAYKHRSRVSAYRKTRCEEP